jgi:glycosyltransferase involved in cell wall biosynthesis
MNIVIFHHFDYPEGMASTKRFQLFADYFLAQGCNVTLVLKTNSVNSELIEKGIHLGINYIKIHTPKRVRYPNYYNKKQQETILNTVSTLYSEGTRNIILTGGVTPELYATIKYIPKKWELYCDYVEDYTLIYSMFIPYFKTNFIKFIKLSTLYCINLFKIISAEKYMFKNANGISAISPYLYDKAKRYTQKVISVPITSDFSVSKKNKNTATTLFYAGSGSLKDGLETLIIAFDKIALEHNVCLKISGKLTESGVNIVKKSKAFGKIQLLGFLKDKDYFQEIVNADILLMTRNKNRYSNAGFPYKIGEYLATKNLVISTTVCGIETYLEDKKSALLISPDNVDNLIEAIEFGITNIEQAKQIGEEGFKVFKTNFYSETNCELLYNFILNK